MTSELRVDNLKGSTTGGSINVLGEGTSATTNLQQGLAKSWVNFTGTSTVTVNDSLNNASVTDSGTGQYVPNMTNAMGNANYSYNYSIQRAATNDVVFVVQRQSVDPTTTTYNTRTFHVDDDTSPVGEDAGTVATSIHGDLA